MVRAWLVTVAVLAVHVLGVGHFALFGHSRCEHGELVHGVHAHHAERPRAVTAADEQLADEASQGEGGASHEHCEGTGITAAVGPVPPVVAPLTLLPGFVLEQAGRHSFELRAVALLALAPKSSPPV